MTFLNNVKYARGDAGQSSNLSTLKNSISSIYNLLGDYLDSILYIDYCLVKILNGLLTRGILLIAVCLFLLTACGGGGGGGGSSSIGDSGGDAPTPFQGDITPISGGFSIEWHSLEDLNLTDPSWYLSITFINTNTLMEREYNITIADFVNNTYRLTGLIDGEAYRVSPRILLEYSGNASDTQSIEWSWQRSGLDDGDRGIVVGVNYDGDGLADEEDWDDDNDGVNNTRADGSQWDLCRQGALGWTSDGTTDYDRDGCRDEDEDDDNDNDGVNNTHADGSQWDLCRRGALDWTSDGATDYDGDGCRDDDEDWDDDNDGVNNTRADGSQWDLCRRGALDWTSDGTTDYDGDGCRDDDEDWDDDNDGVNNVRADGSQWDLCRRGALGWLSSGATDYDGDGCHNDEDWDDDNDGVNNTRADGSEWDLCRRGALDWTSDGMTDYDGDGCRDDDEDSDKDNDGVFNVDEEDGCELTSDCDNDSVADGDEETGCAANSDCDDDRIADGNETMGCVLNPDCDNDTIVDGEDMCLTGQRDWRPDGTNDVDNDGCHNDEDSDNDNDGVLNDDEVAGCELLVDCDNDRVADGDEEPGCIMDSDCDDDEVVDGDEPMGCALNPDCDNDRVGDGDEMMGCILNSDCDNDGDLDGVDIDEDGDGLIEIRNASELDLVRHRLSGNGLKQTPTGEPDMTGCGGTEGISHCSGYELTRDISLADYIADIYPRTGWQPIAPDDDPNSLGCDGDRFTGTFEGNGFAVRGLSINRSDEECVGFFGQVGGSIRNLGVVADRILGKGQVGSLAGYGRHASIIRSYGVSSEVRGTGGNVGSLVGDGQSASIIQSYGVSGEVRGSGSVGGLMGDGTSASVIQSYAVTGEVRGTGANIAGLVGYGADISVVQSYAVSCLVSGNAQVGGLTGTATDGSAVDSYVVSGDLEVTDPVAILFGGAAGLMEGGTAQNSYWDTSTSGVTFDQASGGRSKTSTELRSPTGYTDPYNTWSDKLTVDNFNDNGTIWCDEDQSGRIEDNERRDNTHANGDNRVWDFGTATDYPAIRCTPDSLAEQRAWWSLVGGDPQLNQTHLDAWLDGSLP